MRLLPLAAVFCLTPLAASASTIYSYAGQDYTQASAGYTTSESVTGSFTVNTPLAVNLSNATVAPASFSFSDGVQTITGQTAFSDSFAVSTDSQGNISGYTIQIYNLTSSGEIELVGGAGALSGDTVRLAAGIDASNQTAGSFSSNAAVAATPEPASLFLLGTGLMGLVAQRRFRRTV